LTSAIHDCSSFTTGPRSIAPSASSSVCSAATSVAVSATPRSAVRTDGCAPLWWSARKRTADSMRVTKRTT
jgi:hypothetical protein